MIFLIYYNNIKDKDKLNDNIQKKRLEKGVEYKCEECESENIELLNSEYICKSCGLVQDINYIDDSLEQFVAEPSKEFSTIKSHNFIDVGGAVTISKGENNKRLTRLNNRELYCSLQPKEKYII
jgi:transcription initiation factor TFIIIB Brf1 subunit/transcription initiation factor TFIIB